MTKEQLKELVAKGILGQCNQVDIGNILPTLFNEILDMMAEASQVGNLASLDTEHKSDLVGAINELAGIVETPHFEISFSKSSEELKAIYEACAENITLAKNIVFFNANDELYYRVNGYAMVSEVLKLHTIMQGESGLADTVINLASNGTLSIG